MKIDSVLPQVHAGALPPILGLMTNRMGADIFETLAPRQSQSPCAQVLGTLGLRITRNGCLDKLTHGVLQGVGGACIAVSIGIMIGLQLVTIQTIGGLLLVVCPYS